MSVVTHFLSPKKYSCRLESEGATRHPHLKITFVKNSEENHENRELRLKTFAENTFDGLNI